MENEKENQEARDLFEQRYQFRINEMIQAGFTRTQAEYLIHLLDKYIPIV